MTTFFFFYNCAFIIKTNDEHSNKEWGIFPFAVQKWFFILEIKKYL